MDAIVPIFFKEIFFCIIKRGSEYSSKIQVQRVMRLFEILCNLGPKLRKEPHSCWSHLMGHIQLVCAVAAQAIDTLLFICAVPI